jgi:hypothetical protein
MESLKHIFAESEILMNMRSIYLTSMNVGTQQEQKLRYRDDTKLGYDTAQHSR